MTKRQRTRFQILGLVSISIIIAAATYGFAHANPVNSASILGVGYGVLSEYRVGNIEYTLDEVQPTNFTAVEFSTDDVVGSLLAGVSTTRKGEIIWADSCQISGNSWICTFNESINVLDADWLHVVAD
jgi:hypothetical protein